MSSRDELRGYTYEPIAFSVSVAGENTIRAAVPGRHLVVVGYWMTRAGLANVKFTSDDPAVTTSPTDITGNLLNALQTFAHDQERDYGLFWTGRGHALNLNLSGAFEVSGYLIVVHAPSMPPTIVV